MYDYRENQANHPKNRKPDSEYMESDAPYLAGELDGWPSKSAMASLLRNAGLSLTVGRYSIRINDFQHFVFQEYGGDLGEPSLDVEAETIDQMMSECGLISKALSQAQVRHRFEIYGPDQEELTGYLHYDWPLDEL